MKTLSIALLLSVCLHSGISAKGRSYTKKKSSWANKACPWPTEKGGCDNEQQSCNEVCVEECAAACCETVTKGCEVVENSCADTCAELCTKKTELTYVNEKLSNLQMQIDIITDEIKSIKEKI